MKLFPSSPVLTSLVFILVSGCSSSGSKSTADSNHPANPDAASAAPVTADHHDHDHASAAPHDHSAATAPTAAQMYECPMHPKVRSTNPEDRCPECGMKINKKVPQESPR